MQQVKTLVLNLTLTKNSRSNFFTPVSCFSKNTDVQQSCVSKIVQSSTASSVPCLTPKMERFVKIVKG